MNRATMYATTDRAVADASGGMRSRGRVELLKIFQGNGITEELIGRRVKCSSEFVSLVLSGKRKPQRWVLRVAFEREYGIRGEWWDELE